MSAPWINSWRNLLTQRWIRWTLGMVATLLVIGVAGVLGQGWLEARARESDNRPVEAEAHRPFPATKASLTLSGEAIVLGREQQQAIGLRTEPVVAGSMHNILHAPGQVVPDESRYAYITPRAAGVVRSVAAHVGQDVRAGDLLATIDSPQVAEARLNLVTRLQELEIARSRAEWQEAITRATLDLIARLKSGATPKQIEQEFESRPVGENRERLMTAYAQFRLAGAMLERSQSLRSGNAVSLEAHQQTQAEYDASLATYQALMDRVGFEARLEDSRARQVRRQAETAVKVARERLRVLGVRPDGTEPEIRSGRVVGVRSDGTLPATAEPGKPPEPVKPEAILPESQGAGGGDVDPVGAQPGEEGDHPEHTPIGTFSIWAPFDGTIIDRELVVPGVAVDTNHRIFQLADLSKVWVEVKVREADFGKLVGQQKGKVRFTSPAYPDRTFEGRVIYTGDLVDQQTRAILLLAEAENPERLLKPGMFVEVEVVSPKTQTAAFIPQSALLSMDDDRFVYVRTGPEQFARRGVELGTQRGQQVAVLSGLAVGDEVVVHGAFKLKAAAERQAADDENTEGLVAEAP